MNGNRNRYSSVPMYGIKGKKEEAPPPPPQAPQAQPYAAPAPYPPQGQPPYPPQGAYQQPAPYPPQGQPYQQPVYAAPQTAAYSTAPQGSYAPPPMATGPAMRGGQKLLWLQGLMAIALPLLFLAALLISNTALRWGFLITAAMCVALMWALKAFVKNARATLSLIYGALMVVIGVALFVSAPAADNRNNAPTDPKADTSAVFGASSAIDSISSSPTADPTDSPANASSAAQQQLELFMSYWVYNQYDSMLSLCRPQWVENTKDPQTTLFAKLGNRTPMTYNVEGVDGSEADSSRTISLLVNMNTVSNQQALYRYAVLMLKVNNNWYIDPDSLSGVQVQATPDPNATVTATPAPSATPNPKAVLFYNPDGGKYYHAVRECTDIYSKYWPKLEEFSYQDLNATKYKNLLPCPKCNAPAR